jgi:hypothetical protein
MINECSLGARMMARTKVLQPRVRRKIAAKLNASIEKRKAISKPIVGQREAERKAQRLNVELESLKRNTVDTAADKSDDIVLGSDSSRRKWR